jgi:hypothetical protein
MSDFLCRKGEAAECLDMEEGFQHSWSRAIVLQDIHLDDHVSRLVRLRYVDFIDDKSKLPLEKECPISFIRPEYPQTIDRFLPPKPLKLKDEVDVFENDIWWVSNLSRGTQFSQTSLTHYLVFVFVFFLLTGGRATSPR